jgi:hypothetical protein
MSKQKRGFWFGLVMGGLGGILTARILFETNRMPNAKVWQRILTEDLGAVQAGVFIARVRQRYKELKFKRPIFRNMVLDFHVTGGILPGLALYQSLREEVVNQDEAIAQVHRIFETWFNRYPPLNMRFNQLMQYTPENFGIFRRLTRLVTERLFPAPGWRYEFIDDNNASLAFNIHECFYLKVLDYYHAPELTPVFCRLDDYLMGAMPPSIAWGRTQTIGMGADCCNFRWDFIPDEKIDLS